MKTAKTKLSRRHFLLAAGAATAAGVSTMSRKEGGDAAPTPATGAKSREGYQVTEHVRSYYRTTRI
jgi:hypothetical protein